MIDDIRVGTHVCTGKPAIVWWELGQLNILVKPENPYPEYMPDESDEQWVNTTVAQLRAKS